MKIITALYAIGVVSQEESVHRFGQREDSACFQCAQRDEHPL
jgi:hypothetical protein